MIRVVGFCGLAGSGKTTAARLLEQDHGFTRVAFAGPIKAMAGALGMTLSELAGDLKEKPQDWLCGKTPRQFMQLLGTEFGRHLIGPDFWVRCWRRAVDRAVLDSLADMTGLPKIVADDVRFANEAAAIRSLGGVVIRLDRPGAGSASGADHASERVDIRADVVIDNSGDEAALARALQQVLGGC